MLLVQIHLHIWPMLTLKPIFRGHPFPDLAHSDIWRAVAKRSEICAQIVLGANRKLSAASSNQSMHLTWVDLETHNSRSSIFVNNFIDWATDQTGSAGRAQNGLKKADLRKVRPFLVLKYQLLRFGGSLTPNPSKLGVGIGFPMQTKMLNISKTVTGSAIVCMGANRKPYAASSKQSLYFTCVDLETHNSRSFIFEKTSLTGPQTKRKVPEVPNMAQKTRICVMYALLGSRNLNRYDLGSPTPKTLKLGGRNRVSHANENVDYLGNGNSQRHSLYEEQLGNHRPRVQIRDYL